MKHILILFMSFIMLIANSQKRIKRFDLNHLDAQEISLSLNKKDKIIPTSFKQVFVFDKRNDTSLIGLTISNNRVTAIKLKGGTEKSLSNYINQQIISDQHSDKELVIIIRKLWISDFIENEKSFDKSYKNEKELMPGIIAKFELYIKEDHQFTPLSRYDTVILAKSTIKQNIAENLKPLIGNAIIKTTQMNLPGILNKTKKITWEAIDSFSNKYIFWPVLTAFELKKGVYKSFQEFTNNNPSVSDFFVRAEPEGSVLVVKDKDNENIPARKIWGFCDGDRIYVQLCNNFFQLARKENTFFTFAAKKITYKYGMFNDRNTDILTHHLLFYLDTSPDLHILSINTANKILEFRPLLLDMENGIFY